MQFSKELRSEVRLESTWVWVAPSDWLEAAQWAHSQGLVRGEWLTAAHEGDLKFSLFMCLSNQTGKQKYIFATQTEIEITSVSSIYLRLEFHERETQQLFGLRFLNMTNSEPALQIQVEGFPLRRDFSLTPRVELPWPGQVDPEKNAKRRTPPGVNQEWLT